MSDTSALSEYVQKVLLVTFQLGLVVLRPIALVVEAATIPLSPTFYPFPLTTTLHALRVSHAYKGRVKALGHEGAMKARGLGVELAGYLAMVRAISRGLSFVSASAHLPTTMVDRHGEEAS
jgi:hypothetical protein